jgi:hypothetical protein
MDGIDVTVAIVFHGERYYALPALSSMKNMVEKARLAGLKIEACAFLDKPDSTTKRLVRSRGFWLDSIHEVSFGDLGTVRNIAVNHAKGKFLAFFDGDDLWGEQWILKAFQCATSQADEQTTIWHPEYLYYFSEADFDAHSINTIPNPNASSFHMRHISSTSEGFIRESLFLNNIWSANVFAHKALYREFPYLKINDECGLGIEDWSWNIKTIWNGISHEVAPDTVHLIRMKEFGSLGQKNASSGLLPYLPDEAMLIPGLVLASS